jgi:hypothetical protein
LLAELARDVVGARARACAQPIGRRDCGRSARAPACRAKEVERPLFARLPAAYRYGQQMGSWTEGEPAVMPLPSGRMVRGRGLRHGVPDGMSPQFGLYLQGKRPPAVAWPSRWVRWPDWWLPLNPQDARDALLELYRRAAVERVEVACNGGRGRTGTALACLAICDGIRRPMLSTTCASTTTGAPSRPHGSAATCGASGHSSTPLCPTRRRPGTWSGGCAIRAERGPAPRRPGYPSRHEDRSGSRGPDVRSWLLLDQQAAARESARTRSLCSKPSILVKR